jgi:hypothetical protein
MRFYISLYLLIAAVYFLTASGRLGLSDSFAMFNVTQSIVTDGSLSSEPCDPELPGHPNHCVLGRAGRHYAGFGVLPSILAVPALLAARESAFRMHLDPLPIMKVSVSLFTVLLSPLIFVVVSIWIVRLGYSCRAAALLSCVLAFASPVWHYGVKGFYSEPYFTLALVLSAYFLSRQDMSLAPMFSGLAFGAACGCRVSGIILFPAFILAMAIRSRVRRMSMGQFLHDSALFSVSFFACVGLIGWANYVRFDSPFRTGYHMAYPTAGSLLSNPLPEGIYQLLFNGEVGLLIFVPWVVIAFYCFPHFVSAHLAESVLCGTIFLFSLLFFAKYDSWHGGWVAGPRFLSPTLPFLALALAPLIERGQRFEAAQLPSFTPLRPFLLVLVFCGFLVQILGVIYPEDRYYRLALYYENKQPKPWWLGSIPLASFDFLTRMNSQKVPPAKPTDPMNTDQISVASVSAAVSEDDFLQLFPNPENLNLPNLMLAKMRGLRRSTFVVSAYIISALAVGTVGLLGLAKAIPHLDQKLRGIRNS